MYFPSVRSRRLRKSESMRRLVRETRLSVDNLVYPMFISEGKNKKTEINSMPGIYRQTIDNALHEVEEVVSLGIPAICLFGIPDGKDPEASSAFDIDGVIQVALTEIKKTFPELILIADTCLCEYTSHGHCGIVVNSKIVNDPSIEVLGKVAVTQAQAGADIIAPSDMLDGRVEAIRWALDNSGYEHIPIMSYAVKYASSFYSPFREAAKSTPSFGDRKTYQMDYSNSREAAKEIYQDISEGADIIMIKPAMAYLDIVAMAREITEVPIAAYNVSGEYSMIKAAAAKNWIDEKKMVLELATSIKRAGADLVFTYFAKDIARWLSEKNGTI
ncbi:MAG: porphobilinogen synthase [Cyanobacteriota bacterium]